MNRLMTGLKTRLPAVAFLAGALTMSAACGDTVTQSRSSSYLIIDSLTAASGADATTFSNTLASDVVTKGTVYEDPGQVNLRIALKDPGTNVLPTTPSTVNDITVYRYRVVYTRSDGRNTAGVDVPYPFDGAATATVSTSGSTLTFVIVRAQAKGEAPLGALQSGYVISTIAQVTFYGRDQAGNETSVTGTISVNFANWADPQ